MLRSLKKMLNYSVLTLEGEIGKAVDFYFDNKDWVIRYLVTALSGPGDGNAALIPPSALIDKPDWESGSFALNVGAEEVKKMPGLEKGKPLTRAHETVVHEYFSLPFYWLQNVFGGPAAPGIMTENPDEPDMPVEEEESHPHTHSFTDILSYKADMQGTDSGKIYDLIIDDSNWEISYAAIELKDADSRNKKRLISAGLAVTVDHHMKKITFMADRDAVEISPEYDPATPINRVYEEKLYDYYGRPGADR